jgi:hypothetical protein
MINLIKLIKLRRNKNDHHCLKRDRAGKTIKKKLIIAKLKHEYKYVLSV